MKVKKNLLTINSYSRPAFKIHNVKGLVIHWVANPGTTALQNRNFFELRRNGQHSYGSTHYICDNKGIIQCIPTNEMAYHVGARRYTETGLSLSQYPNDCTLGIEMCHHDETGEPDYHTYRNVVDLSAKLCEEFNLDPMQDIYRHHDITGKNCPKYYVSNNEAWEMFKIDVRERKG